MKTIKLLTSLLLTICLNNVFAQPIADFTVNNTVICSGTCVNFTDLSTGSPTSWFWDFGNGNNSSLQNPSVCYTSPGSYTVWLTVSDSIGTDTIVKAAYIVASASPSVNAGPDQVVCRGVDVYLMGSVSGGTTTGSWSTSGTGTFDNTTALNAIYTPSAVDTTNGYVELVLISTGGSCGTGVDTVGITITMDNAGTVTVSAVDASCNGLCDGSATASAFAGTPPYVYAWDDLMAQSSATAIGLCNGMYFVSVTDALGCLVRASATITEPTPLVATITQTAPSTPGGCDGDITAFGISGGVPPYTYIWNDGGATTLAMASNLCAGTYCITITDNNGCVLSNCGTVVDPPCALSVTTTVANATCNNCDGSSTAVPAGGSPPYTYLWNDSLAQVTVTAAGLCAGSYSVTVVDVSGCTAQNSATITGTGAMSLSFVSTNPSSPGASDGAINMTVSGGTSPYTYNWASGAITEDITTLIAGTYCVTVTDSVGCSEISCATITDPLCGFTTTSSSTPATCASSDGTATVSVTGGIAPFTYLWDDPGAQTTATAVNLAAATYTFWVTDSGGCVQNDAVLVNSTGVNVTLSKTDPSSQGACDGTASISPSGGTPPYTYLWNTVPVETNSTAVGLCAGTYCVTVTDNLGCTQVSCATLDDSCSFSVTFTSTNVICNGVCDGSATANASGGVAPYFYVWSTGDSTQSVPSLCAGTYNVLVNDSIGCVVSANVVIVQPVALSATISANNTSGPGNCDGITTVASTGGTAPYAYQWDDPMFQITTVATGLCSGSYTVIVVDANGCTDSVSVTVNDPSCSFTVTTSVTNVTCGATNGTATASVTGGFTPYTYLWDDPAAQTTATAVGLNVGMYTVAVSDSGGCVSSYSVTVNSASSLSVTTAKIDPSSPGACDGTASASSSGGMAPYTYLWSDPASQTTAIAVGLCAGTYCVTVADANGCIQISCSTLDDSCSFNVTLASTDASCNGVCNGSIDLTVSGGGLYTYNWIPGGTTSEDVTNLCAGTYTVAVTDSAGCVVSASQTITEPVALSSSISVSNTSGSGNCDGSAAVTLTGGTPPYTYAWNDPALQTIAIPINLCSGTYTVTVVDANGCTISASATVADPSCSFTTTITSTNVTCGFSDGTATASVSGGIPPYTYNWNTAPVQTTSTAVGLNVGTYTVSVSDSSGCVLSSSVTVNSASGLTVIVTTSDPSVPGACDGMAAASTSGGLTPYTYLWDDPGTQTTAIAVGLCAGTYSVQVFDANGCMAGSGATLIDSSCALSFLAPTSINVSCNGLADGVLTVNPTGGTAPYTYAWSDPAAQITQTAVGLFAGSYVCVVTDGAGCVDADTISIVEPASLAVLVSSIDPSSCGACDGTGTVVASGGTAPYAYSWASGNASITETGLCTGVYGVTVTDANACTELGVSAINSVCDSVWPGDANSDGVANNLDLLSIGIAYGNTGPARPGATSNWVAQYASNWIGTLKSGVNYKHVDCNGDAVVDDNDTLAISLNYGLTHNKGPVPSQAGAADPTLYLDVNIDTISTGMQLNIPVMLGTSGIPATGVYGMAFTINYDPSLIDTASAKMNFDNSWLGTLGVDLLSIQMDMHAEGQIDVAVTRTDMTNVDGFGQIASIGIVTIDNLSGKVSFIDTMMFSVSNATLISSDETVSPVNYGTGSVIIEDTSTTGINNSLAELQRLIKVYPNPAKDLLNIEWNSEIVVDRVVLYSVFGEEIKVLNGTTGGKLVINTSGYADGIYFIKVESRDGTIVKKLSIHN